MLKGVRAALLRLVERKARRIVRDQRVAFLHSPRHAHCGLPRDLAESHVMLLQLTIALVCIALARAMHCGPERKRKGSTE